MSLSEDDDDLFEPSRFTVVVWCSFLGTVILSLVLAFVSYQLALGIGILQLAFIIYVTFAADRARNAQKREEANEISDAKNLADQCMATHKTMIKTLKEFPEDYVMYMALNHLASEIRLFISKYRRYIDKEAAYKALEAENIIMHVKLSRDRDLGSGIAPLGQRIEAIKAGILDVNDPSLRARRGRM